jgi:hypothetical protein
VNRILRAVVLIGSCLLAVVLFLLSGMFPSDKFPVELPPALAYRWFELTTAYPVLAVVLPAGLVALGIFAWSQRDGYAS